MLISVDIAPKAELSRRHDMRFFRFAPLHNAQPHKQDHVNGVSVGLAQPPFCPRAWLRKGIGIRRVHASIPSQFQCDLRFR